MPILLPIYSLMHKNNGWWVIISRPTIDFNYKDFMVLQRKTSNGGWRHELLHRVTSTLATPLIRGLTFRWALQWIWLYFPTVSYLYNGKSSIWGGGIWTRKITHKLSHKMKLKSINKVSMWGNTEKQIKKTNCLKNKLRRKEINN